MKKILLNCIILVVINAGYAQNTWTQKANFGGNARYGAAGFSIGGKGYIGTGSTSANAGTLNNDFWEYDPQTDSWTQKANFGGGTRYNAVGFSIGNKGYIGTGWAPGRSGDFWEYDPFANAWTQKASFGGTAREAATGFSIGNKGYIGTGFDLSRRNDFWEYDPQTNTWTQKANFGGSGRNDATGFTIDSKGYIGTGRDNSGRTNDFWEYNPQTDTWTQKANFGGGIRSHACGLSIGNKGYIGTGLDNSSTFNDFWEYDPITDTWTQKVNPGGFVRADAICFSVGGKGYLGTGSTIAGGGTLSNDYWEYTPDSDGDGYSPDDDCDDTDPDVNPGATEVCNGIDDDCDGQIDEGCGPVTISVSDASILEGNSGKKKMKFTVKLNRKSTQTITVAFATSNGTALLKSDYVAKSGTVTFPANIKSRAINISIKGDLVQEPNETFTVNLSNPVNATIADGAGTGTILNDDGATLTTPVTQTGNNTNTRSVKVTPIPAQSNLYVQLYGYTGNVTIQLCSMEGKVLKQQKVEPASVKLAEQQLNVADIAAGIYFLTVIDDKGNMQTEKVIVAR